MNIARRLLVFLLGTLLSFAACVAAGSKLKAGVSVPGASLSYESEGAPIPPKGDCVSMQFFDDDGKPVGSPVIAGGLPATAPVPNGADSVTIEETDCPGSDKKKKDELRLDDERFQTRNGRLSFLSPARQLFGTKDRFASLTDYGSGAMQSLRTNWLSEPPPLNAEVHFALGMTAVRDGLLFTLASDEEMTLLDLEFNNRRHGLPATQVSVRGWHVAFVLVPWRQVHSNRGATNRMSLTLDTVEEQDIRFEGEYDWQ